MAGLDEARARSALADMQDRLARGPVAALGIAASATAEDARAAFLQLTKQFHPVRFGRMAGDVQKLANEVFLALRAAHDQLIKSQRRAAAPITAAGSQPLAAGASKTQPVPVRTLRSPTPEPADRTSVAAGSTVGRAAPPRPGARMPSPSPSRPIAAAPAVPVPAAAVPAAAVSEATAIDLLQRQQWDQARSALHQLAAREPNSKRIRALVCYARGREAQLDRRVDDARVELQDALDLDPGLQLAKTALTELFTRRK